MKRFQPINVKQLLQQKEKFYFFCYTTALVLLGILEGSIAYDIWKTNTGVFWAVFITIATMLAENIFKMFFCKDFRYKIACYVLDFLGLLVLTYFTESNMIVTLCIVLLSEFYLSSNNFKANLSMFLVWEISYVAMRLIVAFTSLHEIDFPFIAVILSDMMSMAIHFVIMVLSLTLYRKNEELAETVEELNTSNRYLQEAYDKIAETTAIEERQKIAKDIHDTAGHSITTVIMQTEAAKLILEKDPVEAKKKIVAANMQAKNALEELRTSVHLLSGRTSGKTLKDLFERIIADTINGTDIAIRSEIEDIDANEDMAVFLCNTFKEGLANGIRHGGATAFWVELKQDDYAVSFVLSDNGTGANIQTMTEGFGLSGMRKRAEGLGGFVRFTSEMDEGFEISLTLPKNKEEKDD